MLVLIGKFGEDCIINKNVELYYRSAESLGLTTRPLEYVKGFELQLGKKHYLFCGGEPPFNSSSACVIASNKYWTNQLLRQGGVPVPKGTYIHVSDVENGLLAERIKALSFPLVIKPMADSSKGRGVLCNIQNFEQFQMLAEKAFEEDDFLVVEEFHARLKSYRVLVFKKKVIAVVWRYPAQVVGDGKHSIQELIDLANAKRQETADFLAPIVVDEECQIRLTELGLHLESVLKENEQVSLCYTCNATRGGSFEPVDTICKENQRLMIKVATLMDLELAGIDVECVDISLPIEKSKGVIIEVNHRPSIRIHETPMKGAPQLVANKMVRSLIYRHPLAYLSSLYIHRRTGFYIRSFILMSLLGLLYRLL